MLRPSRVRRPRAAQLAVAALGVTLLAAPVLHGQRLADADAPAPPGVPAVPAVDDAPDWPARPPAAGTPPGTTLAPMGAVTVTTPGTVLSGRLIRGTVTVAARNVTVAASRIDGRGDFGVVVKPGASARILHTTITGFDNAVTGSDYVANYVEATGLRSDGFKLGSRVVVVNSWCHDMLNVPGAHADCAQVQAGEVDVVVRHNWFDIGGGNSALFVAPSLGPSSPGPVTIVDNVVGGGNYTVFCVAGAGGRFVIHTIRVLDNWFIRRNRYGPVAVDVPVQWSGNRWRDNGAPVLD